MLREILGAIDFQNTPDSTRLMKQFFEVQYEWVSSLLQQKFQTGFVHSSVEQIESRVKATYQSYGRVIDTPFQLYGITLSLALQGGENEKALEILAELHESIIPQIRASADLSLLLRRENIPLDVDVVVAAVNAGMIFQYPFNWYPVLLEHLIHITSNIHR